MTKIDIISGFLGAGKTTFIKKMLEDVFQGEKIVLIENEFGEIGIDGGFLKDSGIEISELNSGCICCSLVGDFGKNLREVMERFHPDRILIEPSGVGKLSDVMKSVQEVEAENEVKLNGRSTVVNTPKATKQMKAFVEFFNNQIEYATVVVLSRTQNVKPEQTELVTAAIREKNPKASNKEKLLIGSSLPESRRPTGHCSNSRQQNAVGCLRNIYTGSNTKQTCILSAFLQHIRADSLLSFRKTHGLDLKRRKG